MRNRWYSPQLGQFMSHDPLEYIDSYDLYAFAKLDPINFWDPWGTDAKDTSCDAACQRLKELHDKWIRDNILEVDQALQEITAANREAIRRAKEANKPNADMGKGEILARATAQAGLELWEFLTPQTADDAWGDAILTAGTGGIGKLAKNVGKAADVCKGGRCKVCSFTYTTPVLMCDGSLKEIHEVQEGDFVLAQNKETGEIACREVVSPYANPGRAIILVTLESVEGETEVIETTDNHPFYVEGRGWTRVDELVPGDLVPSAHSGLLQVVALEWTPSYETVYNFGVDEFYTYFVGELGAWVHNCSNKVPGPRNSISDAGSKATVKKLPRYEGPKPTYHINEAHIPGHRGFNKNKTPLPEDAEEVFKRAVPSDPENPAAWFGKNTKGEIYRFSSSNDGTAHFSGIDGVGDGIRNLTPYAKQRLKGH